MNINNVRSNIWKMYIYRILCSMLFLIPVFILYILDNGLSMTETMIIQSVYTLSIMFLVVPAAAFADMYGRRNTLLISTSVFVLGWLIYAIGSNFWVFLIAELFLAFSASLYESSASGFVYETLKHLKEEFRYKKVWGNIIGIDSISVGVASLIGAYVAADNYRLAFYLTLIPVSLALFISFSLKKTRSKIEKNNSYNGHIKESFCYFRNHKKLRNFIIAIGITGSVGFAIFLLNQPYLKSIGLDVKFFGLIYLAMSIITALASRYSYKIENLLGEKSSVTLLFFIPILALGAYLFPPIGLLAPLTYAFYQGYANPIIMDYINKNVKSHNRSTVLSFKILIWSFISAIYGPIIGVITDIFTIQHALGLTFGFVTVNFLIWLIINRNSR